MCVLCFKGFESESILETVLLSLFCSITGSNVPTLFFLGSTVLCPCLRWSNKSQVCCVLRMHTEAKKSALSRPSWGFAKSNHVLQQEDGLYCIEYTRSRFSLLLNCRKKLRIPMPSSNSRSGVPTTRNILTIQDTNRHNRYAPAINHATNATRT